MQVVGTSEFHNDVMRTWMVATTVRPLWAILWMTRMTIDADRLSKPLVGSSVT
jgi:hypothetical protein